MRARSLGRVGLLGLLAVACNSTAGMYCLRDSDCRSGLVCSKAPSPSPSPSPSVDGAPTAPTGSDGTDAGVYGICQPALRGLGQTCLYTSECQPPLICSNQIGEYLQDEWHGTCQPPGTSSSSDGGHDAAPVPDAAPSDAAGPPDAKID